MDLLHEIIDFIRNLKPVLNNWVGIYGPWIYGILFAIVFCETGLVICPFLPGDSLLFTAGVLAHGKLNVWLLFFVFTTAAVVGDNLNYYLGKTFGSKAFRNENSRIFRRSYLKATNQFFEKYGTKTLIYARFVPFVRTFAPFVAGMGAMTYPKFILWSIIAAVIWVSVCLFGGYLFGQIPVVESNFELAILGIVAISVLPPLGEILVQRFKHKKRARANAANPAHSEVEPEA